MRASGGGRLPWADVPDGIRGEVDQALGAPVVEASNQTGGFSPGTAARCRLSDGTRAFVKAASVEQNPHTPRIHRREAEVAARLPGWVPAPALRHVVDRDGWVVLVFDDVEGRTPDEPWTDADLDVVVPAVVDLTRQLSPAPVGGLQTIEERYREAFAGWRRLAAGDGDADRLDPWARAHLDRLAAAEAGWPVAARGDTLLHTDLRADNVVIGDDGRVWFVDWPWACTGAAFVDPLLMLPSIGLGGGPAPPVVAHRYGLFDGVGDEAVTTVLVALAGFFVRASLDPPPPGIPAVRRFQAAQGEIALRWLRTRW